MPERVYRDLTPGLCDVPAETWSGATVENVSRTLEANSVSPHPERLGLRELTASIQPKPMSEAARLLLAEICPKAIPMLDRQYHRAQVEYSRVHGEYYDHRDTSN